MFESITNLADKLAATGYFIDPVMTQVVFLAAKLQKPLLLEGPAGSGKTQVYLSRGTIEASLGNRSAAISDMRTALGLADLMHNFRGLTDVGGTLAQTYFDSGQLHEALDAINSAIQANTNIPK